MSRLAPNEKSPALCLQIPWRRRMKKTLISLTVFSAFTVVSSPVFAYTDYLVGEENKAHIYIGQASNYEDNTAIGHSSKADGTSVAIGNSSSATGGSAVAIGPYAGKGLGLDPNEPPKTVGMRGVALGAHTEASRLDSSALGANSTATARGGVALGAFSVADRKGGETGLSFTETDGPAEVWQSNENYGVVSVGGEDIYNGWKPFTRQITGVAAGTEDTDVANVGQLKNLQKSVKNDFATKKSLEYLESSFNEQLTGMGERVVVLENGMEALKDGFTIRPKNGYQEIRVRQGDVTMGGNRIQDVGDAVAATDAVNKRQLDSTARSLHKKINDVDKDMKAGVAMALAVASLPQAYVPGKSMLAMSAGTYQGQSGFALGLSHATENRAWIVKGSATVDTRGNFGGSLGAGYQF